MFERSLSLPQDQHFFLFGARNTGKSTLLAHQFHSSHCLWIDLLDPEEELRFTRNPNELCQAVEAMLPHQTHVVLDEIQKIPKLLNVVHSLIEKSNKYFVMSGSSARKLKRGGVNLLAGRAFVYHLHPYTVQEWGTAFQLIHNLQWGALPRLHQFTEDEQRQRFLQAYAHTYLKEEIWSEQFIRRLDPFRRFLEVAAQMNGKIVNFAKIARDVGADGKTIKEYFNLLEDTLVGFFLEPFQHSFRKRLSLRPKFYFFDIGITRALARQLSLPLQPRTSYYEEVFEHFIILECIKLADYYYTEYRFSYLSTKDDAEVDLVVERPGKPLLFIEIKSSNNVQQVDLRTFSALAKDFGECQALCFSQDPRPKQLDNVTVLPWEEGIKRYFTPQ